jgi:hypothetical protein
MAHYNTTWDGLKLLINKTRFNDQVLAIIVDIFSGMEVDGHPVSAIDIVGWTRQDLTGAEVLRKMGLAGR